MSAERTSVMNPVDGGTRESGGRVHQIVGDYDDLVWATELAAQKGEVAASETATMRDAVARHRD